MGNGKRCVYEGTNQAGALEERNMISYSKRKEIRGLCGQGAKRCMESKVLEGTLWSGF